MVYLLVFLSGFAGLVYEIVWIKRAALAFGSSSLALSTVLAVFFLGLGIGSYAFGRIGRRVARPLLWCAGLELVLAINGLLNPFSFGWAETAFGAVYNHYGLHSFGLTALRAALIALVLLPPTLLMGGTLPLFVRQLVRDRQRISAGIGNLYGVNTLGATLGCAATGFGLLPWVGLTAATLTAAGVNLLVAIGFYRLTVRMGLTPPSQPSPSKGEGASSEPPSHPSTREGEGVTYPLPLSGGGQGGGTTFTTGTRSEPSATGALSQHILTGTLFFLIGAAALANELVWARFLTNFIRNTVYTYTITLTVVLAGTVLGSLAFAPLFDRARSRRALLLGFAVLQAASALLTLLLTHLPVDWWQALKQFGMVPYIILMLPPAIVAGASFPLANRIVIADPAHAPRLVGQMTAINILGCIVGSLVTGYYLLPERGLDFAVYTTTGVGLAASLLALGGALAATWTSKPEKSAVRIQAPLATSAWVAACCAVWLLLPDYSPIRLPQDFIGTPSTLVGFAEGYNATLAAIKRDEATIMLVNQLWQGSSKKNHQIMVAHTPMLHYPDAKDVLVIGLGVGQTASRFLKFPIRRLDIVDIEPRIFDFVREHFESAWMADTRVRLLAEDGRGYVKHGRSQYDIVSVEVGQLFRPGVDVFYTREFYREARARLRTDGMIVQFVPLGFLREPQLGSILKTFLSEFPQASLWYNGNELLLMGFNGDLRKLSAADYAKVLADTAIQSDMAFSHWGGAAFRQNRLPVFAGGFLASGAELAALADRTGASVYTDDKPELAYAVSDFQMSDQRAAALAPLVAQHLSPIRQAFATEPDAGSMEQAEAVRRLNLGDLIAGDILDQINPQDVDSRPREIEPGIETALGHNPKNLRGLKLMGDTLIKQGREQAAIPYFQRALELDEDDALARRALSFGLVKGGRFDAAIPHLERVLKALPDDPETLNSLAVALINLNRIEDSLPYFRRAAIVAPGNLAARQNLQNAEMMLRQQARQ